MSQGLRMLAKDIESQPLIGEGISRWKLSTGHASENISAQRFSASW